MRGRIVPPVQEPVTIKTEVYVQRDSPVLIPTEEDGKYRLALMIDSAVPCKLSLHYFATIGEEGYFLRAWMIFLF